MDPATRALLATSQPASYDGETLHIVVPNDFTRSRIDQRLKTRLEELASERVGAQVRVTALVDETLELPPPPPTAVIDTPIAVPATPKDTDSQADRLNPKYTFDTFVIGPSNRFAHAAAVAVAESPGRAYNPLMIYGASGLGKTHLLHAIGHYILSYTSLRVKYVSTEEMTNDFINALSDNKTAQFRAKYREVDVLLLDDIQFLEKKIQTQEEFFHTFNTLHNAQKQIITTSDRPPKSLEELEPRLRSRFEWGLTADIQPADLETRIAILRKKAAAERLSIDADVLEFIASNIQTNIRELE
ncbi:MAG: chromosomal replication initiator protein DnaA, partial [Propionibacteriaceae bacterium]|nr:chromosomal replication initiator protein DnaA [Propionibacteriaceae bacterium]